MATAKRKTKTSVKIRPVKRSTPQQRAAMKRSYAKWKRSAPGLKYARMKSNPAAYKRHLMERITKIRGWITKLRNSKDPLKIKKIANHNLRIKSLQQSLKDL